MLDTVKARFYICNLPTLTAALDLKFAVALFCFGAGKWLAHFRGSIGTTYLKSSVPFCRSMTINRLLSCFVLMFRSIHRMVLIIIEGFGDVFCTLVASVLYFLA